MVMAVMAVVRKTSLYVYMQLQIIVVGRTELKKGKEIERAKEI